MLMGNFVRRGAFIECRDKDKDTPLLIAASKNHLGTIKTLLNHGADIGAKDSNDETPIYRAASEGCIEALEVRCFLCCCCCFCWFSRFVSIYDVAVVMIPLTQRFFPPSYCSSRFLPWYHFFLCTFLFTLLVPLHLCSFVKLYIQSFNNVQLATWGQYRCSNVERNFVYPNEST